MRKQSQPRRMALRQTLKQNVKLKRALRTRADFERVVGMLGAKGKAMKILLETRRREG